MKRVALAVRELHQAENELAGELLAVADRHKDDHDIFHVARDLAGWSRRHMHRLAELGRERDIALDGRPRDPEPPDRWPGDETLGASVRRKGAELLGRGEDPRLLLLRDLRGLHRMAAGVSLDWEILAQTAQALKDRELLDLAKRCHPGTLRQLRWANATLKENAPQIMTE
ncbi:MAG: hypothetical protein GEV11_03030 [Streptosporangiales bacterium]|nr:hypothetical protein [Streptosporangiales bacterium]